MSYKQAINNKDKKQPTTASEAAGQNTGQQIAGDFDSVITNLEDKMIDYIGAKVVQGVMSRLSRGDLGTTAPKLLMSFKSSATSHLTEEIKQIEAWDNDPKLLLPSSSESIAS
ncbi:hypothetical protein [Nostoc sp. FACHB-110]|uniref:hypothetical protein n=1 Tax=Nostoc sp. FACHB-110 TaxID=2692834 RepID=UPI00168436CE|nr:hypothetical protein [Nostoc sp. FACHB-110]MBD2437329.1 hypothetical protein [Nostoc sp. FACHB-110]